MKLRKLMTEISKQTLKVGNQPVEGLNFLGIPIDYHDAKSISWPNGKPRPGQKINLMINHYGREVEIVSYHNLSGTYDDGELEQGFKIQIDRDNSPEKYIKRIDAYLVEL